MVETRYFTNMSKIIEAIYENGVLKPTEVLELREHQIVKISIASTEISEIKKIPPIVKKIISHLKGQLPIFISMII